MKLVAVIIKSFKENLRNWQVLLLVLLFAPFFVLLMKLFYGSEATVYKIGIIDLNKANTSIELIDKIANYQAVDAESLFSINSMQDKKKMEEMIKGKDIDMGIIIPEDYSIKLDERTSGNPAMIQLYGTMTNSRYMLAAIIIAEIVNAQGMDAANMTAPATIAETFLEKKEAVNEFDSYVPSLISLAVLMIIFTATASIVKENDKKTLVRLKLSRLGVFNFLAGESVVQALIAILAIVISYSTAQMLGYKSDGKFLTVLIVGIISSLSMVSISLIIASFLNTVFDVLTVGCFPFFILMFFSGSMFPIPKMNLFTLAGHTFGVTDILPLTHTANAFNQILNNGAGIQNIMFEICMIMILTVVYFIIGLILYQKRKFSKA